MSKKKKPTMMEVKTAINNLIRELSYVQQAIMHITNSFNAYLDYKDEREGLTNWLKEQVEKEKEDDRPGTDKDKAGTVRSSDSKDRGTSRGKANSPRKDKIIGIKNKSNTDSSDAKKYT
jgi:hypothetical protein